MGRKIPAKKHRGVKDPLQQHARRLQSVAGKINAAPRDPDEQPVPRSLARLFTPFARDPPPDNKPKKKRSEAGKGARAGAGGNPVAALRRLEGEPARAFSRRINDAVRSLTQPHGPDHYPEADMEEEDVVGMRREARARRKRGGAPAPAPAQATRAQRRRTKIKEKRQAKAEAAAAGGAAEVRYERVPFGAVASEPPRLAAPRHATPKTGGARAGLLLASPAAAEQRRLAVVAAYRAMKAARPARKPA